MRLLTGSLAVVALLATTGRAAADEADRCATEAEQGQAARVAGKLRAARAHVITCAAASCPRVIRSDCARWLTEIETELPTLVIRASDANGADLTDVAVFIDDEKMAERVDGRPIPVDAGERSLRIVRRNGVAVSQRIVVRSGEHGRIVAVQVERNEAPRQRSALGPLVLGGVGLGLVGGGALLWALGRGEHSDLESTCAPRGTCATGDIDAARTKLIIGDVAAAVGVLAIAGAVYWYLSSGSSPRSSPRAALLTF